MQTLAEPEVKCNRSSMQLLQADVFSLCSGYFLLHNLTSFDIFSCVPTGVSTFFLPTLKTIVSSHNVRLCSACLTQE